VVTSNRSGGAALIWCALTCVGLCGCANFWDDLWIRESAGKKFDRLTGRRPDPMEILRTSTDGDERAEALEHLQEPLRHGGTQEDQEVAIKILTAAAKSERYALCRKAAIKALRDYQDDRAVVALEGAYYNAGSFEPNQATFLKCQALDALGATGNPAAVKVLVSVLKEPPVANEASEAEKEQNLDVRKTAARALGHFKQTQASDALLVVLRTETDVALKGRAAMSLREITGKELSTTDAQAWADALHNAPPAPPTRTVEKGGNGDSVQQAGGWRK
jgi:hypothetical protein